MKQLITAQLVKTSNIGVNGNLFGGQMCYWLDEAGALYTRLHYPDQRFVTLKTSETIFRKTVHVNDPVQIFVTAVKIGNTSLTLKLDAFRYEELVAEQTIVFVCVDEDGHKKSISR